MRNLLILFFALLTVPLMAQEEKDTIVAAPDSIVTDTDSVAMPDSVKTLPWPQSAAAAIDNLLRDDLFKTSQVGIMVWDLTADSCIYRYNERQRLRPASTMKAVTAIAALDYLGTTYSLRTELRYKGTLTDSTHTFNGDFYCVGGMDPMFDADGMRYFAQQIKGMGVDTLRGYIYADRSFKSADRLGEGWCWDDDNPVLTPLLFARKDDFTSHLVKRLREAGVVFIGGTGERTAPSDSRLLCARTHGLTEVMRRMLKKSDNLYAEAVFYQMAHRYGGRLATDKSGRAAVNSVLRKAGVDASVYYVADGSGLSLYNYVSALLEVRMLRYAYQHRAIYDALYPLLPIGGVDGTLDERMRYAPVRGNVHAKTGTVEGIRSLCGYVTAANGHKLCFSIINQGVRSSREPRRFQDRVCTALAK